MNSFALVVVNVVLVAMILLVPFACYRVWIGPGLADRVVGLEKVSALLISITVLLALITNSDMTIDIGIILAALGFAGTMAVARYIAEGRVF